MYSASTRCFTQFPLLTALLILVELTEKQKREKHKHLQISPYLHYQSTQKLCGCYLIFGKQVRVVDKDKSLRVGSLPEEEHHHDKVHLKDGLPGYDQNLIIPH